MRNIFLTVLPLVVFCACQSEKYDYPVDVGKEYSIVVSAKISKADTRTILADRGDRTSFQFEEGDTIGFYAGNILKNIKLTCTNGTDGRFKNDRILLENEAQTRTYSKVKYAAYFPYNQQAGVTATTVSGFLPATQNAPYDPKADYMVTDVLEDDYDIKNLPNLDFTFSTHLFSIVKLSVVNTSDELAEERILDIGLKSSAGSLAGAFSFDALNPLSEIVFESDPNNDGKHVRVVYPDLARPKMETQKTHVVYAIVNKGNYPAGSLELVVTTTHYVFSLPTIKSIELSNEHVTVFPTVDLSSDRVVNEVDGKDILTFSLATDAGIFSAFDISDGLITVQVPNAVDLSEAKVSFTNSSGSSVYVDGVIQTSNVGTKDFNDFSNPLHYVVESNRGNLQDFEVRIFDLPVVTIETPVPITDNKTWRGNCSITIRENGEIIDYGNEVEVRGRGNSTWARPKKPYTFKLSKKASVLGMPADKRWNLLANYRDRTLIRNDVSLEIAHRTEDLGWSSHGKFVELVFNGKYQGTYYLCEHNKIATNRVNITEMKSSDISDDAITGGYLLEFDSHGDGYLIDSPQPNGDPYFISATCKYPVYLKSPDDPGFDLQWNWIRNYINNLEALLSDEDAVKAHRYLEYMDIDSYIDWWFVYELTGNGTEPQAPNSCFMHKDRGGKMHAGPVWDFDMFSYRPGYPGFQLTTALYYKYLFKDPLFVARVKEKWPALKHNLEGMLGYIDAQIQLVSRTAKRNGEMWPIDSETAYNLDERLSVSDACARLRSFYQARVEEFDKLIEGLTVTPVNSNTGNEDFSGQTNPDFGFGF